MWVHSEHTKQVAVLLAQSRLKKVATDVLSCAFLTQKFLLLQIGQIKGWPLISTGSGVFF